MKKILPAFISLAILVSSCGTGSQITRESQYEKMYAETPVVLLVMPPINNTSYVDAKDLLYTSISKPLAEAGYYVISPFLAMDILKTESAYDAELFTNSSLVPFKNVFGADAVVFSEIQTWTKSGFGIQTKIRYFIKSVRDSEIIFDRTCDLYLDLNESSGSNSTLGLLVDLASSALKTAFTEHIDAARLANSYIFDDIPRGKYHPDYQRDQEFPANERDLNTFVRR